MAVAESTLYICMLYFVISLYSTATVKCDTEIAINTSVELRYGCPGTPALITCMVTDIVDGNDAVVVLTIRLSSVESREFLFRSDSVITRTNDINGVQTLVAEDSRVVVAIFSSLPPNTFNYSCIFRNSSASGQFLIAGTPNQPSITELEAYQVNSSKYVIALRWMEVERNSDIAFYEVQVGGVSTVTLVKDTEDVILVDSFPPDTVTVQVTAVNECGARSDPALRTTNVTAPARGAATSIQVKLNRVVSALLTLLTASMMI